MKNYLLRGSFYLITGQVISRALTFFYSLFLARNLGVESFGVYSVALAYFSLLSALADFGFSRYQIREVSKNTKTIETIVPEILALRLLFAAVLFVVFATVLYFLDSDKIRSSLSILAMLAVFPQVVGITLDGLYLALQKAIIPAITQTLMNISSAVFGVILLLNGYGTFGAVTGVFFGQIAYVLSLLFFSGNKKIFRLRISAIKSGKLILAGSLPYGLLAILGLLYFRIDAVILSYLRGSYEAGIYSAAYRFLEAVIFIPASISLVLFPRLSKLHDKNIEEVRLLTYKVLRTMALLGGIVAVIFLILVPVVINFFLPDYSKSVLPIIILSFAIPFIFIHVPLSQVVLSSDRYLKPILAISVMNMLFNVVANLVFIPTYGYLGASFVTVGSDVFSLITLLYIIHKYILKK